MFLGLSGPNILRPDLVMQMSAQPIIFAQANPNPEIMPADALAFAPDAIITTGRSDFPNQVNNVLCFPFIFGRALDAGATEINDAMQVACIQGIEELARATTSAEAAAACKSETLTFSPNYLIPKPFGLRLSNVVSSAVAEAAMQSGFATQPIKDIDAYRDALKQTVVKSEFLIRLVFEAASNCARRIVFSEGENERVLRPAQAILEETSEVPIVIGRPEVI